MSIPYAEIAAIGDATLKLSEYLRNNGWTALVDFHQVVVWNHQDCRHRINMPKESTLTENYLEKVVDIIVLLSKHEKRSIQHILRELTDDT